MGTMASRSAFDHPEAEIERNLKQMADAVTEKDFDAQVLESEQPVLVDFWAEWCGPCHAIAPVLDQIAEERSDLRVVKLNIDEEPAIAQRYGVMSIPTLILFKDGEPAAAAVGAMPKSMLEERLGLAEAAA
jgi:thioredoxin 1